MALLEVIGVVVVGSIIHWGHKAIKEEREEKVRRINSWQGFHGNISEGDFVTMTKCAQKGIKQLRSVYTEGAVVHGVVRTRSGLSEWRFNIDFNDYGSLTGKYWLSSDNNDSSIPKCIADRISNSIINFPANSGSRNPINDNSGNTRSNSIKFCS